MKKLFYFKKANKLAMLIYFALGGVANFSSKAEEGQSKWPGGKRHIFLDRRFLIIDLTVLVRPIKLTKRAQSFTKMI